MVSPASASSWMALPWPPAPAFNTLGTAGRSAGTAAVIRFVTPARGRSEEPVVRSGAVEVDAQDVAANPTSIQLSSSCIARIDASLVHSALAAGHSVAQPV